MKTALQITKDTKVGVLCGGLSEEREVSLRSGNNCFNALKRLGYKNAQLIDVGKDIAQQLTDKHIEVAFLALHGRYGEDGAIQGLLELLHIPYTGSGILSSALAMSKPLTKDLLRNSALPYPHTVVITAKELKDLATLIKPLLPTPVMVKPLNEGSSVGVAKVETESDLEQVITDTVIKYGGALVERYIKGPEITVGVLEESKNGKEIWALPILELRPKSKAGFYDYEAKYTKGMTDFVLPAELDEKTTKLAKDIAIKTFRALHCRGYARVDMMVDSAGQPHVLEVNTLPGMTDTSDLPAMAEVAGISYEQLVERILHSADLDK